MIKEPFNGLTHILGAGLALVGLAVLVLRAANQASVWHVVSFTVYGVSLTALYTASAVYHALNVSERANQILKQFDHAMIYFLIAGTYTPVCLVVLRGGWGWTLFGINWALAVAGMAVKLSIHSPSRMLTAILFTFFLIMGWMIVVAWGPLTRALPEEGIHWLVWGGISYTLGALVLNIKKLRIIEGIGAHELWHLFVMAGSFCHFLVMYRYVLYLP